MTMVVQAKLTIIEENEFIDEILNEMKALTIQFVKLS